MKLQIALDTLTLDECIELLNETKDFVDIAEIGTPFIIECGMEPVRVLKEKFPMIEILADAKIMDAGELESESCYKAGADIVTVLGVSHDATIEGVINSARKYSRKVMVDMIAVENMAERAIQLDKMGVDYICVHTAFDIQQTGQNPLEELKIVNSVIKNAKSAVAGGVKLSTINDIVSEGCEVVVVGGAISNAGNRQEMARKIKERMN